MNGNSPVAENGARWFTIQAGHLRVRADPAYAAGARTVERRYAQAAFPLASLGSIAVAVQYGSSARPEDSGDVRVVRMTNVRDGTLDLTHHRWLRLSDAERRRFRLVPGDILFNRTNSKELVGKCAVFEDSGEWVFASYLIRVRCDRTRVEPHFLAIFLNAPSGRLQIDRDSRQIIGMANVNASELRGFLIPVPPLEEQRALIRPVVAANSYAQQAKFGAEGVDEQANRELLNELDVQLSDAETLQTFAVAASAVRGGRLDAPSHAPIVRLGEGPRSGRLVRLSDIALINPRREGPRPVDGRVPYVGLPECTQKRVENVSVRESNTPIGRSVAVETDILFARIEPSVFNRKYVFLDDLLGHERVYVSGEFIVVSPDSDAVDPRYLHEVFLSDIVARQIAGKTTGSSGRRRIDRGVLEALMIPVPPLDRQSAIVRVLAADRKAVDEDLANAESALQRALVDFENAIFSQR
jgi:type I restriction enzyme, S subunit